MTLLILSPAHIGQRLGVDRRTALRRIEKAALLPIAITPSGEVFYAMDSIDQILKDELFEFPAAEQGSPRLGASVSGHIPAPAGSPRAGIPFTEETSPLPYRQ